MMTITDSAIHKLTDVLLEEGKPYVRFGLQGGGCSGFQYYFLVEEIKEETDSIYPLLEGKDMIIDYASMMYLQDMSIDYREGLMEEGFVFSNPGAVSTCGCGSSVSFE
jgi:iron-sulfur cluster assembly accessory protein